MTYETKLLKVRALIEEHNDIVDDSAEIVIDDTIANLKACGGTTEERLKRFSFEEVEECIVYRHLDKVKVKAKILAKDLAEVFRSGVDDKVQAPLSPYVGSKKAKRMTPRELVEAYDPASPDSAVAERLNEIAKGKAFIVFLSGRTINVDTTLKLLDEIKIGHEARTKIKVGEKWEEVHAVGYLPNNFADENPIYHKRPLRPDGTCDITNSSWEGVSTKLRQLVFLAVRSGAIKAERDKAFDILDMVHSPDGKGETKFTDRYPEAAVEWDKLNDLGNLPTLKIPVGSVSSPPTGAFGNGKPVEWYPKQKHAYGDYWAFNDGAVKGIHIDPAINRKK